MNKVYQRIWSKVKERWILVLEKVAHGCGPAAVFSAITLASFLSLSGTVSALDPGALPTKGKITSGNGSISTSGSKMTVKQTTPNMIANWRTFNIGTKASVTFKQPSSSATALNKIYDQNPSQILGKLSSNGNIYLINPSGIVFGEGSQINVGGLVASSLNISDSNFLAGKYVFTNNGKAGSVLNQGNINAINGGVVALIAPSVINEGTITANGGDVVLAAGNQVTLDFKGDGLINYTINKGAIDALAENSGVIRADGGMVVMTAKAADTLTQAVVNNSGVIEAQTLKNKSGRILLLSDMENGTTIVGGTLDASAPKGGNGGFIETSGATVKVADGAIITTAAPLGTTGTWQIDPYDFTIAASGGDVTGAVLTTALASNNVTIQTLAGSVSCTNVTCGGGTASGNGDIFVNDNIMWSAHTLTLNAYRNIEINKELFGSGTAQLTLFYGQGAVASGNTATYSIKAPVDLPAGNNFSTKLGSDGVAKTYYVITTLGANGSTTGTDLQGMSGNLSGYYALGSNIDASTTSTWNAGLGFSPIGDGNGNPQFTGQFDGLGHTIANLTINRPSQQFVGLFGFGSSSSSVSNVGLMGGSVSGSSYVGGLMGDTHGTVSNAYATGIVSGSLSGDTFVGGLVGVNWGLITSSYTTGNVSGGAGSLYIGGLVGFNSNGTISNAYATGNVSGSLSGGNNVGGLVGDNQGGTITNSYATGNVSGVDNVGGLVGENAASGSISNSYATGIVSGTNYVGGLVGQIYTGAVSNAYATSSVSGTNYVGGLIGVNKATITNTYAIGSVTSTAYIGGLVGWNEGTVNSSYSTGTVSGTSYRGALIGINSGSGKATNSYWDYNISGSLAGVGYGDYTGVQALYTTQMMQTSYMPGLDFTNTWFLIPGNTRPFLQTEYSTKIINAHQLQLMAMHLGASYTLGANIDMAELTNPSGMWGTASGTIATGVTTRFSPIGNGSTPFTGQFDGQNHTITNLTITRPSQSVVGLFGDISSGSSVRNVGLVGGSVSGSTDVGVLVGYNYGTISNAYATGNVSSSAGGDAYVGGLVGVNNTGTITNSYATGNVSGSSGSSYIGGLLGYNYGTISNSYATGSASGSTNYVGGLVGYNAYGSISNAYASGSVSGTNYVGGLVGYNYSGTTITNAYATGSASGSFEVGGLVGWNSGTVSKSYATGSAGGIDDVGGLAGGNFGTVSNSYATGSVNGSYYIGGLLGCNFGTISNTYATGSVTGAHDVGGLVGGNFATITNTYATGLVNNGVAGTNVGGLVGGNFVGGSATSSFWNTETTGQSSSAVGTASNTTNMKTKALTNGLYSSWNTSIWNIVDGSYPTLKVL